MRSQMELVPGASLGPYRIVEQVGRGGMATVFKAFQPALNRYVAIKVLPPALAADPQFEDRFTQEAMAVASLRHPNILTVYDYGQAEGVTYLVTEFVDGGTLADQMRGRLPLDYVISMLRPVASALDYAHSRAIVHRDVKPSNVLLTRDGTPVLADFGLARMMDVDRHLTQAGVILGTPEYIAPEQCAGTDPGPAADQYSLAVIAYQMLTGQVPFSAETPAAVIIAQMTKPLPPPRQVNRELSEAVEAPLLKGLAKEPGDRFPSASAFLRALEQSPVAPAAATVIAPPAAAGAASSPAGGCAHRGGGGHERGSGPGSRRVGGALAQRRRPNRDHRRHAERRGPADRHPGGPGQGRAAVSGSARWLRQ
jgi:eukaryotic-like serine/threonine-protein kinase